MPGCKYKSHLPLHVLRRTQPQITCLGAKAGGQACRKEAHLSWEAQEGLLEEGTPQLSPRQDLREPRRGGISQERGQQRDLARTPCRVCLSVSVCLFSPELHPPPTLGPVLLPPNQLPSPGLLLGASWGTATLGRCVGLSSVQC